jgi:asparagine synthase (glutamine-hydrolysing)
MYPYYQYYFLSNFKWKYLLPNANEIKRLNGISMMKQVKVMLHKYIKTRGTVSQYYDKKRIKYDSLFNERYNDEVNRSIQFCRKEKTSTDAFSRNLEYYFYDSLPQLLNVVDKNSMAHSVEARVPFLDFRLVEYVYSLPHEFKIRNGVTKFILKKAFSDLLPVNILNRKKEGYNTAENLWFIQQQKKFKDYVNDYYSLVNNIFDKKYVENLFSSTMLDTASQKRRWDVLSIITLAKVFNISH